MSGSKSADQSLRRRALGENQVQMVLETKGGTPGQKIKNFSKPFLVLLDLLKSLCESSKLGVNVLGWTSDGWINKGVSRNFMIESVIMVSFSPSRIKDCPYFP